MRSVRSALDAVSYAWTGALLLIGLLVLAAILSPQFYRLDSLTSSVAAAAPLVLGTMALTPIAIGNKGGVDLGMGPLLSLINVVLIAKCFPAGLGSPVMTFVIAIALGVGLGLVQGFFVAVMRLQPIIVGLCAYLVYGGVALLVLDQPGGSTLPWMLKLSDRTGPVPNGAVVIAVACLLWWAFSRTTIWRNVRLSGGDDVAAYASGVPVALAQLTSYAVSGVFAGLGAVMLTAYLGSGDPTVGLNYTLTSVAALVLGGTSLAGGRGGMFGSVVAAFAVFLVNYLVGTFNFGTVSSYVTQLSYGAILIAALVLGALNVRLRRIA